MKLWGKFLPLAAAVALIATFSAAPTAAQQTGSVTGLVTDATSGRPLESAQVFIPALDLGSLTNSQGRFLLLNVPAGTHELRVELIGYTPATQQVTVTAGQTVTSDFRVNSTALRLQELVVTGVAGSTPRVKLPFTVEKVDVANTPVPATSAEGLLTGKVPGVKIVSGSGQPGSGGGIMLRGPTTITGSQSPLVIVDGVITDTNLADISSLDIESIEVVKGAAAASLYGSRAQNGVVQITTKRGSGLQIDQSRITVRNEYGQNGIENYVDQLTTHPYAVDSNGQILGFYPGDNTSTQPYPVDIRTRYINDGSGTPCAFEDDPNSTDCEAASPEYNAASAANSFYSNEYPYQLYSPLEEFYNPGSYYSGYVAVEGRSGNTNYRASFTHQNEAGVVELNDGFKLNSFRLNLDHQVLDNLNTSISTYYVRSRQEDLGGGVLYDIQFQAPYANIAERVPSSAGVAPCGPRGCFSFYPDPLSNQTNPLYALDLQDFQDTNERFLGSVNMTWAPISWLELEGNFSLDQSKEYQANYTPKGLISASGGTGNGGISRTQANEMDMNGSFTASLNRSFGDLTLRTKLRYLFEDQHRDVFFGSGSDLIAQAVPSIDNTPSQNQRAGSSIVDVVSEGYFFITSFDYQGKYVGDILVRRDGSSLFGPEERWQNYYRFSGAWRMAQEDWWSIDAVNEFKLRYSLGTAGGRPNFSAQYETYSVSGSGAITPITLGNRFLRPELSTEQEVGMEAVLFNKVSTGLTYAWSTIEDQLLNVPLIGPQGFQSQWRNAGTLESNTIEAYVETALIDRPDLRWTSRVNFDRTNQVISELNIPAYRTGSSGRFYIREGETLGTFYGTRWATSCSELAEAAQASCGEFQVNDDGYLVYVGSGNSYRDGIDKDLWGTRSAAIGGTQYGWGQPISAVTENGDFNEMGNVQPDFNLSWGNTVGLGNFTAYMLLDGEFGTDIYNGTRQWAIRDGRGAEMGVGDKPQGLWKTDAYYRTLYNTNSSSSHFVEDGTYVKIREAALSYRFDTDTVERLFGGAFDGLSLSLIGRNLLTFTDYSSFDPEASTGNLGSAVLGRIDDFGYPNFRTISASLEIIF